MPSEAIGVKVKPVSKVTSFIGVDRRVPTYAVYLAGEDIEIREFTQFVKQITVTDHDYETDTVTITLNDEGRKFVNDPLFAERIGCAVWLGYQGLPNEFFGIFFLDKPKFSFPSSGDSSINLEGRGVDLLLSETEKRRSFTGITDSQIAIEIAKDNKFDYDVEETEQVYSVVHQVNESDMKFLSERGIKHGFQLYVDSIFENNKFRNILHFHKPRYDPLPFEIWYMLDKERSSNISFVVNEDTYKRAQKVILTAIDPMNKQHIYVESQDVEDEISSHDDDLDRTSRDQAEESELGRPILFFNEHGHNYSNEELQKLANQIALTGVWTVKATFGCIGIPQIRSKKCLLFKGIQKFSGLYYIKSTTHTISSSGYTMTGSVRRTGTGQLGGNIGLREIAGRFRKLDAVNLRAATLTDVT